MVSFGRFRIVFRMGIEGSKALEGTFQYIFYVGKEARPAQFVFI